MKRKKSKKGSGLLMISLVSLAPTMTYAAGIVEECTNVVAVARGVGISEIGNYFSRYPYHAAALCLGSFLLASCAVSHGIDWLVKTKAFVSEVIEAIRKRKLYQEQLKTHKQFLKEKCTAEMPVCFHDFLYHTQNALFFSNTLV